MAALPQPLRKEILSVAQTLEAAETDPRKSGLSGDTLDSLFVVCHRHEKV